MESPAILVIFAFALIFGGVFAFCLHQLWQLRKLRREREAGGGQDRLA